ncbi:MAG TPA: dephospho-CoA kinase, partial [Acidimicrobiales bacterium]|nr:dephospho-CoA kinase [Acidimicrobiales bacterium]
RVVVVAIPLYRDEHRELLGIDRVVCVECPRDLALERLVSQRGLTPEDAELRMAAQATRDERRALADEVIDNAGGLDDLDRAVSALWDRLAAA